MITATNNPLPSSPDASPTKLDKGGYEGTAETLDNKIDEVLAEALLKIEGVLSDSTIINNVTTSSAVPPTGNIHAFGIGPGTYPNWGGMIVPANNIGTLQRVDGVYSVSLTAIDLASKVNVSDVVNTLTSTETVKPLSAAQGKLLNDKLTVKKSYVNQITPSSNYNYLLYSLAEQGELQSWYYAKSVKTIRTVGIFLYKDTLNGSFTQNVRVQVLHKRGTVNTVILVKDILPSELVANNTRGIIGSYSNYEIKLDFTSNLTLAVDDVIFVDIQVPDKVTPIFGTENALVSSGEWNYSNNCYRLWITPSTVYIYSNIPALPPVNAQYNTLHFYSISETPFNIISEINTTKELLNANIVKTDNTSLAIGDFTYSKVLQPTIAFSPVGNYYINSSGGVDSGFTGDKATGFIPVDSDMYYRYIGKFTDARGYSEYDVNQVFIKGLRANSISPTTSIVTDYKFKTSPTTKFVRFSVYEVTSYQLYKESQTIDEVLDVLNLSLGITTVDYTSDVPAYIFGIDNDSSFYAREYVQNLYPESLLGQKVDVKVNGGRVANIQTQIKNTAVKNTRVIPITLSGKGYNTKSANVDLVKTKASNAKNKQIRYLAIGDSITANQLPKEDGSFVGGWCYPSVAKEILMMDNKDFGDNAIKMLLLGITNYKETQFTYKSESLTLRGFSEGRGSWTTCNYLRHAMHTTTTSSGSGSGFDNKAAWDAMGLGRKIAIDTTYNEGAAYETYTYTTAQRNLIRTTPWGKYHWDYSAELWNAAKLNNKGGVMDGAGTYTGSLSDKNLLDTYMNYVLDYPNNPFYDKIVSKTTGTHAFSLVTYLSRYKTLADDGVTRLVVGSTAGSLITALNINTIDVATPTHITVELGENERWWFPATAQNAVDDNVAIMNIIATEFPSIKTGFVNPRYIGVMYPDYWSDKAICGSFDPAGSNAFKYQMNTIAKAYFGTLASQTNKFFLPCYYTQSPLSRQESRYDVNLVDKSNIIVGGTDVNHPGILAYWSMGYQVLSWIYYTL